MYLVYQESRMSALEEYRRYCEMQCDMTSPTRKLADEAIAELEQARDAATKAMDNLAKKLTKVEADALNATLSRGWRRLRPR
jgi:hypothetical protein